MFDYVRVYVLSKVYYIVRFEVKFGDGVRCEIYDFYFIECINLDMVDDEVIYLRRWWNDVKGFISFVKCNVGVIDWENIYLIIYEFCGYCVRDIVCEIFCFDVFSVDWWVVVYLFC